MGNKRWVRRAKVRKRTRTRTAQRELCVCANEVELPLFGRRGSGDRSHFTRNGRAVDLRYLTHGWDGYSGLETTGGYGEDGL